MLKQNYKLGRGYSLIKFDNRLVIQHSSPIEALIGYLVYAFVSYLLFSNILITITLLCVLLSFYFYKTIMVFHFNDVIEKNGYLFKIRIHEYCKIKDGNSIRIEIAIKTTGADDQGGGKHVYHFELIDKSKRYNMAILDSYKSQEVLIASIKEKYNIPIEKKYSPNFPKLGAK